MVRKLDIHMQKNEIRPLPYYSDNSKWIKDLNITPQTLTILGGNTGKNNSSTLVLAIIIGDDQKHKQQW